MCGEKVRKHLFGGFLAKRDIAFRDHRLHPVEHRVDVFRSSEPSQAPNRNSSCGVHPHMNLEFPSPIQENTLQAKRLRRCTHQPVACPLQLPSINAQPETLFLVRIQPAWYGSHQDSMRVTRFCHLSNQTSLGRTPRKRASLFNPISQDSTDVVLLCGSLLDV